jgi:alpha-tubulin suppressor-like RCC1 family protein
MTRRTTPVTVSLPITATAIAAGGEHTCALLNDGTARCWGYNFYGQLGNGEFAFMTTPSPVRIAASTFLPILRRP